MKNFLLIFLLFIIFDKTHSIETKIIHNIQNEIITNIDIKNEFKYLVAMNDKLKELDKKKILNISNESAIKEKIKKIEVSKHFKEIKIKEEYLDFLLRDMFLRLDLESLDEFEVYLKNYDLTLETVKKKITINALWNELIMKKYTSQVAINEEQIRKKISKIDNIQSKEYLLSEIIFEIENKKDLQKKYNEIVKSIAEIGFENSASTYSISETANTGGEIGWISENSLNNKIKENINHLQIGEISKPIILSNGILILKIVNNKTSKIKIDLQTEFKKALDYERNRQLSQYSTIYYNKVKKNLEFDG
jgi:peptidyl-prolyl cis-trans isomerase SurA